MGECILVQRGVNSSDATATPTDITSGKTAYVDNELITGSYVTATGTVSTVKVQYGTGTVSYSDGKPRFQFNISANLQISNHNQYVIFAYIIDPYVHITVGLTNLIAMSETPGIWTGSIKDSHIMNISTTGDNKYEVISTFDARYNYTYPTGFFSTVHLNATRSISVNLVDKKFYYTVLKIK